MKYKVPDNYYFRIHHCRPRFKNNVEEVLIYMAKQIASLHEMGKTDFNQELNKAIRGFKENARAAKKTIDNWRTEISSLFGLIEYNSESDTCRPSNLSYLLAINEDLIQFFKYFLIKFQYPGGHLKPQENIELIKRKIKFIPAQYILKLLSIGEKIDKKAFGISKAEAAHCLFNDLRVTSNNRNVKEVYTLINKNRAEDVDYDWKGDVIRYAGDILDYMKWANLLEEKDGYFYLNHSEDKNIKIFIESSISFTGYDSLYGKPALSSPMLSTIHDSWFQYINIDIQEREFATDVSTVLNFKGKEYEKQKEAVFSEILKKRHKGKKVDTKEIGDRGESIIYNHECTRVKDGGREDLIHLIKCIPNHEAAGYDIRSVELDGSNRHIEVKTTISNDPLTIGSFHMTANEWRVANCLGPSYFVYRLMISRGECSLRLLSDPAKLHRDKIITISFPGGIDVYFDSKKVGKEEKVLEWRS
jgi:hypothetical protein